MCVHWYFKKILRSWAIVFPQSPKVVFLTNLETGLFENIIKYLKLDVQNFTIEKKQVALFLTKSILLNDVSSFNLMVKYIPLAVFICSWTFPLFICFIGKRIYHRCVYLYFSSSFETEVFDSSRFSNMAIFSLEETSQAL